MERRDPAAFETEIYAKEWDAAGFAEELRHVQEGQTIALGTATDPYQPAERNQNLTRRVVESLQKAWGLRIYLTTKSDLAARDVDLWMKIAQRNQVSITMTVTTTDRGLARLLEPYAPRPDLRLEAVKTLSGAGLKVAVMASPVLPLITDSEENLNQVALCAKAAGARSFGAHVLFLKPCAARVFFPFLEDQFPHLVARYRANYREEAFLHGSYPGRIRSMVQEIRERHGLAGRDFEEMPAGPQLRLF